MDDARSPSVHPVDRGEPASSRPPPCDSVDPTIGHQPAEQRFVGGLFGIQSGRSVWSVVAEVEQTAPGIVSAVTSMWRVAVDKARTGAPGSER
jgi:hypothetical protein